VSAAARAPAMAPAPAAVARRDDAFALRELLRRPTLLVWCLFLISQPFYVIKSGLPQPGDFLLLPLIPMALARWNGRLSTASMSPLRALLLFTIWVCLVDWGWAAITGNFGFFGKDTFMLFPFYYIYNAMVVFVALLLYQRYGTRFLTLTMQVMLFIVASQIALSFVWFGSRSVRSTIFFNNPNQLGYYALLSACTIAVCQRTLRYSVWKSSLGLAGCMYLALLSASKAAVAGGVMLFALTIITNPRIILMVALATAGMLSLGGPIERALETTTQRMQTDRRPQWSFFEERGYDRIEHHSEYLLFGAGEGATTRFAETTIIGTHEIHSSAGTLLFAYGTVGAVMFLVFVWRTIRGAGLRSALMMLPALAYTVAHQGLRFNSLWVLIGLFIVLKQEPGVPQRRPSAAARAA
ncbi:MAG TPA: hypothetical protein VN253_19650, partial [Kofleriaceae bacterium]|nr:hypothetical protein [Kofleriaceae bacterium]